jgi:hypothetical protein
VVACGWGWRLIEQDGEARRHSLPPNYCHFKEEEEHIWLSRHVVAVVGNIIPLGTDSIVVDVTIIIGDRCCMAMSEFSRLR